MWIHADPFEEAGAHEAYTVMPAVRGHVFRDEPLSRHTSWRVGGPADRAFVPADAEGLADFLAGLPAGENVVWLGLGSNVLVRDGGFRGTVILLSGALGGLQFGEPDTVVAGAGAPNARVARFSAEKGLTGAEFLAGIPGTLGGALAMNAGAFGSETWDLVRSVETMDRGGTRRSRGRDEYRVAYRCVTPPAEEWFISAKLVLAPDPEGKAGPRIRELLAERSRKQPTGVFSCGSVFRNPPGDQAGSLIDRCGLKGMRVGGAVVSEKHANFIINEGHASAADIEDLMQRVEDAVHERTGVRLEREVRVIGEALA